MRILILLAAAAAMAFGGELGDLRKTADKWQPVFHMAGWDIRVSIVSRSELGALCGGECVAASWWDVPSRSGAVMVMRRADYTADVKHRLGTNDVKGDQRNSVVHEMLHCVIQNMYEEAAVQVIAGALRP